MGAMAKDRTNLEETSLRACAGEEAGVGWGVGRLVQEGTKVTLEASGGIWSGQGVPHLFPLTSG